MLLTKVIPIFLVIICLTFLTPQGPPRDNFDKNFPYGLVFKSVKCENFENNGYGYIRNCSVKAYSKQYVALNFGYTLTRPFVKPTYASIIMKYRYGNIYRNIYNFTIEICSLFDTTESKLRLENMLATIKDLSSHIHKCPWKNGDDITNLTFDVSKDKNYFMLPEGYYKACITFQKSFEKPVFKICPIFYSKSPMKESFGK